jgi:hypothetical protein
MNKLVVTSLESQFRVFDMRTYHPKSGFESLTEKAHSSTVRAREGQETMHAYMFAQRHLVHSIVGHRRSLLRALLPNLPLARVPECLV